MSKESFIYKLVPAAQADMREFGILTRIVLHERDYRCASRELQRAGYATDPQYADKLIRIIEGSELTRFDQIEEERGYMMSSDDANKIINFLSAAWMSTEDAEARVEFHRLADELREASGQQ
ncbi:hypothetical protein M5X11_36345 [Paenibacillus alginolyticus]|uniref:glucosaminidase domain-containing protein n=1 Tax=Paenibacillus alginolyticus TaxID=59839 RepID=UPI0004228288|nr:glucosaminidase domain-containing protein [Paenibacillus alginolyticus]MCY9670306.1 hypothetical protein [Paenibacillus alginolyticus]